MGPFSKSSPEWEAGQRTSDAVQVRLARDGWGVVPTEAIEKGIAPMMMGADGSGTVLPDLLVMLHGRSRWVEVKCKWRATLFQKTRRYQHGVDLPNWRHYLKIEEVSGIPGYLAIVQLHVDADSPFEPVLLMQSFEVLRRGARVVAVPKPGQERGMVYWDADLFDRTTGLTMDAATMPRIEPKVVRPWEHAPRTRQPPKRLPPRQSSFDF